MPRGEERLFPVRGELGEGLVTGCGEWKGHKMEAAISPKGLTMADQEGSLPKLTNYTHSEKSTFRAKVHRLS